MIELNEVDESAETGSGTIVFDLVKANSDLADEVENSPALLKQYKQDMEGFKETQRTAQELFALLFDQQTLSTRENDEYKYLDIANNRAIPYIWLRKAGRTEVPRMIKNLRRLQLTQYAEPSTAQKYGKDLGFSLAWRNPNHEPTKEEKTILAEWSARLQEQLFFPALDNRPSLSKFLGEMYEDFFDLDDITVRIDRDRMNYPIGLHLEDPSFWYPIVPKVMNYPRHDQDLLDYLGKKDGTEIEDTKYEYLMLRDGKRYQAVTKDIIWKSHFFVRSDFQAARRGYAIMEQAANTTSIILNAMTYNSANFNNNRTPQGILALLGGFTNPMQLEKLKKILWAQMTGAAQGKRLPIIGLPEKGDAKWISVHGSNKEMEFYTGMTLFSTIVYALSGTNPNESGFANFQDAMKTGGLNQESKDGVWRQSRDTGLITFVSHAEGTFNTLTSDGRTVWEEITGLPVKAEFKGFAAENVKDKNQTTKMRLENYLSINDVRKEEGMDPASFKVGDLDIYDIAGVGSPQIIALINSKIQMDAQKEMAQQQADAQEKAGQQQQQDEGLTPQDKKLVEQYGPPEGEQESA